MAKKENTKTTTFPSYKQAMNYRGGFNKFVYDKIKELAESQEKPSNSKDSEE